MGVGSTAHPQRYVPRREVGGECSAPLVVSLVFTTYVVCNYVDT
jgi:hypothetical protein